MPVVRIRPKRDTEERDNIISILVQEWMDITIPFPLTWPPVCDVRPIIVEYLDDKNFSDYVLVLWERFEGISSTQRSEMILDALKRVKKVCEPGIILGLTPKEAKVRRLFRWDGRLDLERVGTFLSEHNPNQVVPPEPKDVCEFDEGASTRPRWLKWPWGKW